MKDKNSFVSLLNLDAGIEYLQKALNNLEGCFFSNEEQKKVERAIRIVEDVRCGLNNLPSYKEFLESQGYNWISHEVSCLMCNYLDIDKIFKCCQLSEEELLKERWEGKYKTKCSAYE